MPERKRGSGTRSRPWRLVIAGLVVVLVVLGVCQLVLPGVAEQRIRAQLADAGVRARVEVEAYPALTLLFGRVDSATVSADAAEVSRDQVADLIAQTRPIDKLVVSVPRLRVAGLAVTDAKLTKRQQRLSAQGTATRTDLAQLLPPGSRLQEVRSAQEGVVFDGTVAVLGAEFSGPALLRARAGTLVLTTPALPLVGPASLAVFADPEVRVDSLAVRRTGAGLRFSAGAHLADGPAE